MKKYQRIVAAAVLTASSLVVIAAPSGTAGAATVDRLTSINPARYLDTRPGQPTFDNKDAGGGRLAADATYTLKVTRGEVPAGAGAVMMNVTAINPDANGFLTVFPCGTRPNASNVNYVPGRPTPNAVLSAVDANGNVCIYTTAGTDVAVDVTGFAPRNTSPLTVVPARLMDTRPGKETVDGKQAGVGPVAAGDTIRVNVRGRGNVGPAASAAFLNVTAIQPNGPGFLTVFPCGAERPNASSVNYQPGEVVPNAVLSKIGDDGDICIYSLAASHVAVDVSGFVPKDQTPSTITPARLADTRDGKETVDGAQVGGGPVRTEFRLNVKDRAGLPPNPAAVMLNVTAIQPEAAGFLTVYPCGTTRPTASSVNYQAGGVWPNAVFSKVGDSGEVCIYTLKPTNIAVDVSGYVPSITWLSDTLSKEGTSCSSSRSATVRGVDYDKATGCNANKTAASATYSLDGRFSRLTGFVGVSDTSPSGATARVTLSLDGKQIWGEDGVKFPDRLPIDLPVEGGQKLVMKVEGVNTSGSGTEEIVIVGQLDGASPAQIIGGPATVFTSSVPLKTTQLTLLGGCASNSESASLAGNTYEDVNYCVLNKTTTEAAYFNLAGHYTKLNGFVGITDGSPLGVVATVRFVGDGKVLAQKTGVKLGTAVPFDFDVSGVLRLTVTATASTVGQADQSTVMLKGQLNGDRTGQQIIGPPATPGPQTTLNEKLLSWNSTTFGCRRPESFVSNANTSYSDAVSCNGQQALNTIYPSTGNFLMGTRYKKVTGTLVVGPGTLGGAPKGPITVRFYRDGVEVPGSKVTISGTQTKQFSIDVTNTLQLGIRAEGAPITGYESWAVGLVNTTVS